MVLSLMMSAGAIKYEQLPLLYVDAIVVFMIAASTLFYHWLHGCSPVRFHRLLQKSQSVRASVRLHDGSTLHKPIGSLHRSGQVGTHH